MPAISPRWVMTARLLALSIIGLHVAVPLLSEVTAWGVWPSVYLPAPWRWTLAAVAAALVLSGDRLWSRIERHVLPSLSRISLASPLTRLVLAAVTAAPFYVFRIRHLRWGDAELLVKALGDPYRVTYVWQAPLDVFLHARLWQLFHEAFGWLDPVPVYHILSILAGVAFVYVLLSLAQTIGRNRSERILLVGLVATLGTMQLFFGYIENYPIMTFGVLFYVWLGLRTLRREVPIVLPATVLAITHAFHPSTIILVPSLIYLWWRQGNSVTAPDVLVHKASGVERDVVTRDVIVRPSWPALVWAAFSIATPYVLVAVGVVAMMENGRHGLTALATVDFPGGGDRKWFVPLFEVTTEWQHYTMFSLGHLIDIVNQQLLVAPVVWPVLIVLLLSARRRLPVRDASFWFLVLMAAFYASLTLVWNADYGGRQDWDLFSPAAVPAALLLAYVLPRTLPDLRSLRKIGWALITAQGFHLVTWIWQNTRPQ